MRLFAVFCKNCIYLILCVRLVAFSLTRPLPSFKNNSHIIRSQGRHTHTHAHTMQASSRNQRDVLLFCLRVGGAQKCCAAGWRSAAFTLSRNPAVLVAQPDWQPVLSLQFFSRWFSYWLRWFSWSRSSCRETTSSWKVQVHMTSLSFCVGHEKGRTGHTQSSDIGSVPGMAKIPKSCS